MRFMLKTAIISLIVASLCIFGAFFVKWDFSAFDVSSWEPAERLFLIVVSLFFAVGIAEATE